MTMDDHILREIIHSIARLEMRVIELERKISAIEASAGAVSATGGMSVSDILRMNNGRLFWTGVAPAGEATQYCLSHFN